MMRYVVAIVLTMPTLGNAATTAPPRRSTSLNVRISTSDVRLAPGGSACAGRLSTFGPFRSRGTGFRLIYTSRQIFIAMRQWRGPRSWHERPPSARQWPTDAPAVPDGLRDDD